MSTDRLARLGLAPVINASGTMTALGASMVVPEAADAVAGILGEFVDIDDLQRRASRTIAAATGAEAGYVTSSSASGIVLSIAAAITGPDLGRIEAMPVNSVAEVVVPGGHFVNFGAPVEQMVRLAGATPVAAGSVFDVQPHHVAHAISERTVAGLYVVSHHVAQTGQLSLAEFVAVCHGRGVPVIVDMASEYDLTGPVAAGADLGIWSAHKFLGGPTAGIVAGRRDLIRAAYLQNRGIGRAMKVGKEGIAGTIAALEAWARRDHAAMRAHEERIVAFWLTALAGTPGLAVHRLPDWTGNPIDRVELRVDPEAAGLYAWELADRLAARTPSVRVRDDLADQGVLHLDPCNLKTGQESEVAAAIRSEVEAALARGDGRAVSIGERRARAAAAALAWPD